MIAFNNRLEDAIPMKILKLPVWLGCLLLPLWLVGCNEGEDFSDADIRGPIIEPSPGSDNPLGDDVESIEIEFVDDRVLGLGYACRGAQGGTGYTGYIVDGNGEFSPDNEGNPVPEFVECGVDATSVDFFLGDATGSERFMLGTFYLPQTAKQPRYQIAPTDILASPARLAARENGTDNEKRAFYIAALLQALDNDNDADNDVIDIPFAAHEAIMSAQVDTPDESAEDFSGYTDYMAFQTAWTDWHNEVRNTGGDHVAFPADATAVNAALNNSLARLRAGTYNVEGTFYGRDVVEEEEADDINSFLAPLLLQVPVLVYPDGVVQGLGYVADVEGSFEDVERTGTTLAALTGEGILDAELRMVGNGADRGGWLLEGLFDETEEPVALELTGRFLGPGLYYDLDGPLTTNSDYRTDYPQSEVYELQDSDRGFYFGNALSENNLRSDGELLNGYKTGLVAAAYDESRLDGADPNDAPRFYKFTPYKACSGSSDYDTGCQNFDVDHEPGMNYPNTVSDDNGDNSHEITQDQPKPPTNGDTESSFIVEIREDGYVVTDLDENCSATDASYVDSSPDATQEYRVGFVTRTDDDADLGPSLNLIVHMIGPGGAPDNLEDKFRHYGLRTSGRIDLDDPDQPFYRTGDANFDDGIPAQWLDRAGPSGYAFEAFRRSFTGDLTAEQEREAVTRVRGALHGVPTDCAP